VGQGQLPGIKYAFVPSIIDPKTKKIAPVKIRQTEALPIVKVGSVSTITMPFDLDVMSEGHDEAEAVIEEMMATLLPYADGADVVRFRIATGEHGQTRMYASLQDYEVVDEVLRIMNRYSATRAPGHDWGDWLYGLAIEFADNQRDMYARDVSFSKRREGMREIKKLRVDYGGMLEVIAARVPPSSEVELTRDFSGRSVDEATAKLIKSMVKAKLLTRVGDRFYISKDGRHYLKAWTDAQQKIGRY
jgi:hypothetical protein